MTRRIWLIAEREFRAYVATASFWVALVMTPLLLSGAVLLAGGPGRAGPAEATLTLSSNPDGGAIVRMDEAFPLSAKGRADLVKVLEASDPAHAPVRLEVIHAPKVDPEVLSRFALVMMLWMVLTGSLGMLLQATVRERANRALESLLAAAPAHEIVFGKLLGVGAVSALVISVWLGASVALGAAAPAAHGMVGGLIHGLARPELLARAAVVYVLAFAFYGLTTIALGAWARDNAHAQNLARPMFAVLLAVFFVALANAGGAAGSLGWLVYVPPFTPFMLLMQSYPPGVEVASLLGLMVAVACSCSLAVRSLRVAPFSPRLRDAFVALLRA